MGKKKILYDKHHIIPVSRGGANNKDNIIRLKTNKHSALHQLFDNKTPVEQIIELLSINHKVLKEGFKKELYDILSLDIDEIYKEEAYIYKEKKHYNYLYNK